MLVSKPQSQNMNELWLPKCSGFRLHFQCPIAVMTTMPSLQVGVLAVVEEEEVQIVVAVVVVVVVEEDNDEWHRQCQH